MHITAPDELPWKKGQCILWNSVHGEAKNVWCPWDSDDIEARLGKELQYVQKYPFDISPLWATHISTWTYLFPSYQKHLLSCLPGNLWPPLTIWTALVLTCGHVCVRCVARGYESEGREDLFVSQKIKC